jgi:hypothetical protein
VTRPGVNPFFAYDANYLIDNKAGIIIDAEGSYPQAAGRLPDLLASRRTDMPRKRRKPVDLE